MCNKINEIEVNEVKEITYAATKQYFTEVSDLYLDKNTYFNTKERKETIVHTGNKTVVILDDGSKGKSKCKSEHEYDKTKGTKIAYIKAKIKSLKLELEELTEEE